MRIIRTRTFDRRAKRAGLAEDEIEALARALIERPEVGDVIRGSGGARKVRVRLAGRGTSGGARVIYAVVLRSTALALLDAYAKSAQAGLSADELKAIAKLIREIETRWPP
jgi:hypothetical protein